MRSITTLSLLLSLASAIPTSSYPEDCHDSSCSSLPRGRRPSIARINLSWQPPASIPQRPKTAPPASEPHFPGHQLSGMHPTLPTTTILAEHEFVIDNSHLAPAKGSSASEALSAKRPLESTYLLSLSKSNPATAKPPHPATQENEDKTDASLAAKPSSALPELRKEDAARYWASRPKMAAPASTQAPKPCSGKSGVVSGGVRIWVVSAGAGGREYADLIVVGIVVLFLGVVIALEAVEKVRDWRSYPPSRSRYTRHTSRRTRRGAIFLADDEILAYIVPKPRYGIPELEEYHDEKTGFEYDSDADTV